MLHEGCLPQRRPSSPRNCTQVGHLDCCATALDVFSDFQESQQKEEQAGAVARPVPSAPQKPEAGGLSDQGLLGQFSESLTKNEKTGEDWILVLW